MTKARAKANSNRGDLPNRAVNVDQADEPNPPDGAERGMRWTFLPMIGTGLALVAGMVVAAGRAVASRRHTRSGARVALLVPAAGVAMAAVAGIAAWRNRDALVAAAADARGEHVAAAADAGGEIAAGVDRIANDVAAMDHADGSNGTLSQRSTGANAPA